VKLIRTVFLATAVLLPCSWTLAHAGDDMKDGGGEMKKWGRRREIWKRSNGRFFSFPSAPAWPISGAEVSRRGCS